MQDIAQLTKSCFVAKSSDVFVLLSVPDKGEADVIPTDDRDRVSDRVSGRVSRRNSVVYPEKMSQK